MSGIQTKCLLAHIFPLFKRVSRGNFAVSQTVRLRLRTAGREEPLHDQCTARSFGLVAARVRRSRPALPATWFPVQHSRPTLMSAGSPAIPSRHLSPNAENQPALLSETPSPLPTLLAGTHKCRLARRTSDWSIFWRSLSRRLALSLRLIHTIRSQLVLHSPHRTFPPFKPRRHDVHYSRVFPSCITLGLP